MSTSLCWLPAVWRRLERPLTPERSTAVVPKKWRPLYVRSGRWDDSSTTRTNILSPSAGCCSAVCLIFYETTIRWLVRIIRRCKVLLSAVFMNFNWWTSIMIISYALRIMHAIVHRAAVVAVPNKDIMTTRLVHYWLTAPRSDNNNNTNSSIRSTAVLRTPSAAYFVTQWLINTPLHRRYSVNA